MAYGECTESEDADKNCLLLQGDLGSEEDRHRNKDDHNVGRDVEDGIRDQVIRRGGALDLEGMSVSGR